MGVNQGGLLRQETVNYVPKVRSYLGNNRAFNADGQPSDALLDAIRMTESGGNRMAVSKAGAQGPYQFMPKTAKQYGVTDPFDEGQSRQGASKYLSNLYQRFNGDEDLAIASYNAGEGNVERAIAKDKKRGGDGNWVSGSQQVSTEGEDPSNSAFGKMAGFFNLPSDVAGAVVDGAVSNAAKSLANTWLIGVGTVLAIAALIISQKNNVTKLVEKGVGVATTVL